MFPASKTQWNLKQEILPSNTVMFRTIPVGIFPLCGHIRKIRTIALSTQAMLRGRTISTAITTYFINWYLDMFWNLQWLGVHEAYKVWSHGIDQTLLEGSLTFCYSKATFINHTSNFLQYPSHRMFEHMQKELNIVEKNNQLHSLTDYHEMNLLRLINSWLDIICQVTTKCATVPKLKLFLQLNTPQILKLQEVKRSNNTKH